MPSALSRSVSELLESQVKRKGMGGDKHYISTRSKLRYRAKPTILRQELKMDSLLRTGLVVYYATYKPGSAAASLYCLRSLTLALLAIQSVGSIIYSAGQLCKLGT